MRVSDIVDKVQADKTTPGRFPSRVIIVRNWHSYITLVSELQNVCDKTLNLADFAQGDIIPRFKHLKTELDKYANKTILLLSFGEYLRFCSKRERNKEDAQFRSIWEPAPVQPESSVTKYIIPIFGGRDLFDNAVPFVDKRMEDFIWEADEVEADEGFCVTVYSPEFSNVFNADANSFSEWLSRWDTLFSENRKSFSVCTRLFSQADTSFGCVNLKIVDQPFAYIAARVSDGEILKKEYATEAIWGETAKYVQSGKPFSATIDLILNAGHNFDPIPILSQFNMYGATKRLLFKLRYMLYEQNDYISFAVSKADSSDEIPDSIRDAVFEIADPSDEYLALRANALSALDISYDDDYFARIDKIFPVQRRLLYLSYKTHEERTYSVNTVSTLLRKSLGVEEICDLVKDSYSELSEYLNPTVNKDDFASDYFNWYRKSKLINRLPDDIPHFNFDSVDSRNKIIQNCGSGYLFWVDGLGAEWLPLLLSKLHFLKTSSTITASIARSILPSETEFNKQWADTDLKWDRLDKLAHNGSPDDMDYYSCIAKQIEYICEIARYVDKLLVKNNRVIITGDHGSSRLAALMFHQKGNFGIDPPKNAKVRSFGRFCELLDNDADMPVQPSMETVTATRNGKSVKCVVMKTYEHFKQSGNAAGGNSDDNPVAGEIHGGMMPEECLVPVIVVTRNQPLKDSTATTSKKAIIQNDMGI